MGLYGEMYGLWREDTGSPVYENLGLAGDVTIIDLRG